MQRAAHKLGIQLVQSPFLVAKQAAENPLFAQEINRAIASHDEASYCVQSVDAALLYSSGSASQLRRFGSFSNAVSTAPHLSKQAHAIHEDWARASHHVASSKVPYGSSGTALLVEQQPKNVLQNPARSVNTPAGALAIKPAVSPFSTPKTQSLLALYRDYVRGRATAYPAGPQQQRDKLRFSSPFTSTPQAVLRQRQQVQHQLQNPDAIWGQTATPAVASHTDLHGQPAAGASAPASHRPSLRQGYHQPLNKRCSGGRVGRVEKKKHSSTRMRERLEDLTAKHKQFCQQYEQLVTTNDQLTQQYCRLSAALDASLPQLLQLQTQLEPNRTACTASPAAATDTTSSIPQMMPSSTANANIYIGTETIVGAANSYSSSSKLQRLHPGLQILLISDSIAADAAQGDEDALLGNIRHVWSSLVEQLARLIPELDHIPIGHPLRQPGLPHPAQLQQQQQQDMPPLPLQVQQQEQCKEAAGMAAAAAAPAVAGLASLLSPVARVGSPGGPFAAAAATSWGLKLEEVDCFSPQSLSMLMASPRAEAQATEAPLNLPCPKRGRPLHGQHPCCDELASLLSSNLSLSLDAPTPKQMRLDTVLDSFGSEQWLQPYDATTGVDVIKGSTDFAATAAAAAELSAAVLTMETAAEAVATGQGGQNIITTNRFEVLPPSAAAAAQAAAAVYGELLVLTRQLFHAGPCMVYRLFAQPLSASKPAAAAAADASGSVELDACNGLAADKTDTVVKHWQDAMKQMKLSHEQVRVLQQDQSELTLCHEEADSLRRQSVLAFNNYAGGCIASATTAEFGMEKWMAAWAALGDIQDSLNRDYQLLEQAVEQLWGAQSRLSFIQKIQCLAAARPFVPGYDLLDALQLQHCGSMTSDMNAKEGQVHKGGESSRQA